MATAIKPEIPALPGLDAGSSSGSSADAIRALDENDPGSDSELGKVDSSSDASDNGTGNPEATPVGGTAGVGGDSTPAKRGRGRPRKDQTPDASLPRDASNGTGSGGTAGTVNGAPGADVPQEKLSKRGISRLNKTAARKLAAQLSEKADELQKRVDELTAEKAKAAELPALEPSIADEALGDMVESVVDLADGVAQASMSHPKLVEAIALDAVEKKRLRDLGKRVAKQKLDPRLVEQSPTLALLLTVVSIASMKFVAVRAAKAEISEPSPAS